VVTHTFPESSQRLTPPAGVTLLALSGPAVEAVVPLALLEAVRALDLPAADLDTELVHELRNKRFGLSDTVYMQIRRYGDAVKRQQPVAFDEVVALARLVGRRPDADIVFLEAGRRVARAALNTISSTTRRAARSLPGAVGRPLALRHLRSLAHRFLAGTIERQGSTLVLSVPAPVSADAAPNGGGCGFYEAALRELLLGLTGVDHAMQPVACRSRGDTVCQWRTDWRR
jgi:predicted hydrocarbon binding protein